MRIQSIPVPISALLDDLDTMIEPQARGKGLTLRCAIPPPDLTLPLEREPTAPRQARAGIRRLLGGSAPDDFSTGMAVAHILNQLNRGEPDWERAPLPWHGPLREYCGHGR